MGKKALKSKGMRVLVTNGVGGWQIYWVGQIVGWKAWRGGVKVRACREVGRGTQSSVAATFVTNLQTLEISERVLASGKEVSIVEIAETPSLIHQLLEKGRERRNGVNSRGSVRSRKRRQVSRSFRWHGNDLSKGSRERRCNDRRW